LPVLSYLDGEIDWMQKQMLFGSCWLIAVHCMLCAVSVSPPNIHFSPHEVSSSFKQLQSVLLYIQKNCLGALTVYVECRNLLKNSMCVLSGQQSGCQ